MMTLSKQSSDPASDNYFKSPQKDVRNSWLLTDFVDFSVFCGKKITANFEIIYFQNKNKMNTDIRN